MMNFAILVLILSGLSALGATVTSCVYFYDYFFRSQTNKVAENEKKSDDSLHTKTQPKRQEARAMAARM